MKRIFKTIVESLSVLSEIKMIVLYGSFARGEESSRSDIDLLILTFSMAEAHLFKTEAILLY